MSTSEKKTTANRLNGQKSHGPTNTRSTRYNATKHGLLAQGVTELDAAEGYQTMLQDLIEEKNPVGPTELFLTKSAALEMVRAHRARRLEAEYITAVLNPPTRGPNFLGDEKELFPGEIIDPGLPALIEFEPAQRLVTFQRYESGFVLRLFRTLHELERLQRMRKGETVPAPAGLDVTVHTDTSTEDPCTQAQLAAISPGLLEKSEPTTIERINSEVEVSHGDSEVHWPRRA